MKFISASIAAGLFALQASLAPSVTIDLAFITKMPDMRPLSKDVGGLSELASFVHQKRANTENFLFFHGGDSLAPSAMSAFDNGTHMIDLLNIIEPDVYAVNEREFYNQEDQLTLRTAEASFPFISANIQDPFTGSNMEGVEDHECFDIEDYELCAFAILDPITSQSYKPDRIVIDDQLQTIVKKAQSLRAQGADLIVLMIAHAEADVRQLLTDGVVDVALYSSAKEDSVTAVGNGMLVKQGTEAGAVINLSINLQKTDLGVKTSYQGRIQQLKPFGLFAAMEEKIDYYSGLLEGMMGTRIGVTRTPLDTRKNSVRQQETAFGNLLADSVRAYYKADISILNSGGVRGNKQYAANTELTRHDLQSELPFWNKTILLNIKGSDILTGLENAMSLYQDVKGRFPLVSGLALKFCPNRPVGQRVHDVTINGAPLESEKLYSMASLDYLFDGGDGFTSFRNAVELSSVVEANLTRVVLGAYIEEQKTIAPRVEGRILKQCN